MEHRETRSAEISGRPKGSAGRAGGRGFSEEVGVQSDQLLGERFAQDARYERGE